MPLGRKIHVESMFEIAKCQILRPEEKHEQNQLFGKHGRMSGEVSQGWNYWILALDVQKNGLRRQGGKKHRTNIGKLNVSSCFFFIL